MSDLPHDGGIKGKEEEHERGLQGRNEFRGHATVKVVPTHGVA